MMRDDTNMNISTIRIRTIRNIEVFNREQALALAPDPTAIMLSISAPGDAPDLDPAAFMSLANFEFHDIIESEEGLVSFNETMAQRVLDFVEKHETTAETILVHCDAGLSRSVGVGVFLADLFSVPLTTHACGHISFANGEVKRILNRVWHKRHFN